MVRTDCGRRYTVPFNRTPDLGQFPENCSEFVSVVESKETWWVLQERVVTSQCAQKRKRLGPEPAIITSAELLSGDAGGLARYACGNESKIVGDASESAGDGASANAGEEVDLSIVVE
jgi:hypothetical protein